MGGVQHDWNCVYEDMEANGFVMILSGYGYD